MYSWEINNEFAQKTLEKTDSVIDSEVYENIVKTSPQITRVKHNPGSGRFEMWTNDGYYFNFRVVPKASLF